MQLICRWLLAAAMIASRAVLASEPQRGELEQQSACSGDCQQDDSDGDVPDSDAEPRRSHAVEAFEYILYQGRTLDRDEAESAQLDILRQKIAAIDLVCDLTAEQKRKMQLAGQGDIRHLLDQIGKRVAELQLIDDADLPARRQKIMQTAASLHGSLAAGPFGKQSLFDKILTSCLTDDQAARFEPFRNARWTSRAAETGIKSEGGNQIVGLRFSAGDRITDTVLESLKGLTHLEILSLRGTRVNDSGLAAVSALVELRQLELDSTLISDEGLMQLAPLKNLRMLDLRKTRVTDEGLGHLAVLENLKYLCLFNTDVTADGVAALKQSLPKLRVDR